MKPGGVVRFYPGRSGKHGATQSNVYFMRERERESALSLLLCGNGLEEGKRERLEV